MTFKEEQLTFNDLMNTTSPMDTDLTRCVSSLDTLSSFPLSRFTLCFAFNLDNYVVVEF